MTKTVKVRIAVAVDADGNWDACGYSEYTDQESMESCIEVVNKAIARYFVTAELRVPEQVEVEGEVEEVSK